MTYEPAKPIEPGCKVLVTHGPYTGFQTIAVSRHKGNIVSSVTGRRYKRSWGWITDPQPGGTCVGFAENVLMRIDDDDELTKQEEQNAPVHIQAMPKVRRPCTAG